MNIQEKIDKRIEELEIAISSINPNYPGTWIVMMKLSLTNECIKELKQLLNN